MFKQLKFSLFFVFLFLGQVIAQANHPIYILLTHPRATATAFEKVIGTNDGITVLHAPFIDAYLVKKYGTDHAFTRSVSNPSVTFDDVKDRLFKLAETSPVFLKESGYLLIDYMRNNPEFYMNPQVKIAFLIRDPAKSVISYYRKMPTVSNSIIGHKELWDLFEMLREKMGKTPIVIDSDELLKNPLPILNQLGKNWGLQFNEDNLKWESGFAEDWRLKDWYVEVGTSTELGSYRGDVPRGEDGVPLYEEVTDESARERLKEFYRFHNVYYQKLLPFVIKP